MRDVKNMSAVVHRETASTIIIDTRGRLLLQLRDNIPEIRNPGMIGLFGGHRQGDETFLECAVRDFGGSRRS